MSATSKNATAYWKAELNTCISHICVVDISVSSARNKEAKKRITTITFLYTHTSESGLEIRDSEFTHIPELSYYLKGSYISRKTMSDKPTSDFVAWRLQNERPRRVRPLCENDVFFSLFNHEKYTISEPQKTAYLKNSKLNPSFSAEGGSMNQKRTARDYFADTSYYNTLWPDSIMRNVQIITPIT